MADSRVRYDNVLDEIDNTMGFRQTADRPDNIDVVLSHSAFIMAAQHPDGWSWMREHVEKTSQDESITIDTSLDTNIMPHTHGIWTVRTKNTGGGYEALDFVPWPEMMNSRKSIRSEGSTANQELWTVKWDGGAATIETYPYSYASATLSYDISYIRRLEAIAAGVNADGTFIWPVVSGSGATFSPYDLALAHIACLYLCLHTENHNRFVLVRAIAETELKALLATEGAPVSAVKLEPARVLRATEILGSSLSSTS